MQVKLSRFACFVSLDTELSEHMYRMQILDRGFSKHERESMSNEEDKNGEECRSAEAQRTVMDLRPRNWPMPVILLALRRRNSYGYELMKLTATYGFGEMKPGTLYRSLRQMEKDGLCESTWDLSGEGGPARRMYSITDAGEAYLETWAKSLEKYRKKIDAFFRLYTGGKARADQGVKVA